MAATCKACGAKLLWVDTAAGKKIPLNASPFKAFYVKDNIGQMIDVYIPHWATCPKAQTFKKDSQK
jgi:hypothetical protein